MWLPWICLEHLELTGLNSPTPMMSFSAARRQKTAESLVCLAILGVIQCNSWLCSSPKNQFPHLMFSRKLEVEPNGAMIQSFWRCHALKSFRRLFFSTWLGWIHCLSSWLSGKMWRAWSSNWPPTVGFRVVSSCHKFAQSIQMEMIGLKVLILSLRPYIESFRHGVSNSAMSHSSWSVFLTSEYSSPIQHSSYVQAVYV